MRLLMIFFHPFVLLHYLLQLLKLGLLFGAIFIWSWHYPLSSWPSAALGKRSIVTYCSSAALVFQDGLNLRLLISSEVEFFGEHLQVADRMRHPGARPLHSGPAVPGMTGPQTADLSSQHHDKFARIAQRDFMLPPLRKVANLQEASC